jgi:flagellin-like hook-associated protein FlgL
MIMSNIALSAGVRANLLSLQNTASLMQTTQTDLATGNKVNSALDNPLSFFTSQSLNNRANALNGLLDAMSNGVQTIQAANNGITSITSLVQQLQSIVSQARGDTSTGTAAATPTTATATANSSTQANDTLTFNLGGGETVGINTYTHTNAVASTLTSSGGVFTNDLSANNSVFINDGHGNNVNIAFSTGITEASKIADINTSLAAAGSTVAAVDNGSGQIQLVNSTGNQITVTANAGAATDLGFTTGQTSSNGAVATNHQLTNTELAAAINSNNALSGIVSASVDVNTGHLLLSNLSTTTAVGLTGYNGTNVTGNSADSGNIAVASSAATLSSVRQNLMNQFNSLLTQINQTANDSGYNGTNLLAGDSMTLKFNENGTSSYGVSLAQAVNATNIGITAATTAQFASNSNLDSLTNTLSTALTNLQNSSTDISSSLSVVQSRQDFTKNMVNTLQTGASNLVLADPNQEGANLLALQTRQSLSESALSMAAQAQSAVLRLFQ